MDRAKAIAAEITLLAPKLLRGIRPGFIASARFSTAQLVILLRVYEKKTTRIGALHLDMQVSAPTISGVVERLVRDGFLLRIHDTKDRRAVNVELTEKGRKQVKLILSGINKRWLEILRHLSAKEREDYLRILKKIVEVLGREQINGTDRSPA